MSDRPGRRLSRTIFFCHFIKNPRALCHSSNLVLAHVQYMTTLKNTRCRPVPSLRNLFEKALVFFRNQPAIHPNRPNNIFNKPLMTLLRINPSSFFTLRNLLRKTLGLSLNYVTTRSINTFYTNNTIRIIHPSKCVCIKRYPT